MHSQLTKSSCQVRVHSTRGVVRVNMARTCTMRLCAVPEHSQESKRLHDRVEQIKQQLEAAEKRAEELCKKIDNTIACLMVYDEIWDLEKAYYKLKVVDDKNIADPLNVYCKDFPESDECRSYDV